MSTTISQKHQTPDKTSTSWLERLKQNGYFLKQALSITLIWGIILHITGLFLGHEQLIARVLTPTVDMLFAVPMTYGAIAAWLMWKRIVHPAAWHKFVYAFITLYFTVSIPLHVQVYVTQSTAYITAFPEWYSFLVLPIMLASLLFVLRLRYQA